MIKSKQKTVAVAAAVAQQAQMAQQAQQAQQRQQTQQVTANQALMNAVIRQRDDALAKLAQAEATAQVALQDNERLSGRVAELEAAAAAK